MHQGLYALRTVYQKYVANGTGPDQEHYEHMVQVLDEEDKVVYDLVLIQKHMRAVVQVPQERSNVQVALQLQPLRQAHEYWRASASVDAQTQVNLLNSLHLHTGQRGAFALLDGAATSDGKLSVTRNLFGAGYNHFFPEYHANLAGVALLNSGATSHTAQGLEFTTKQNPSFGAGVYGDVTHQGVRVSSLLTLSKGTAEVGINADYRASVAQLQSNKMRAQLQPALVVQGSAQADTLTTNFLLQADYAWQVQPQLTVTPQLTYHYYGFSPSNEQSQLVRGDQATLEYSRTTPFVPVISAHGFGGGLDVQYAVNSNLTLGADLSVMYYSKSMHYAAGSLVAGTTQGSMRGSMNLAAPVALAASNFNPDEVIVDDPNKPGGDWGNPQNGRPSDSTPGGSPDDNFPPGFTPSPSGPSCAVDPSIPCDLTTPNDPWNKPQPSADTDSNPNYGPGSTPPNGPGTGDDVGTPNASGEPPYVTNDLDPFAPPSPTYTGKVTAESRSYGHLNITSHLKLTYKLNPHMILQGKVGYTYLSDVQQSGFTYNLNLGWKF